MAYVDGFVIPILKRKIAAYKKMAQLGKRLWMKHGALEYFECVGDDLKVKKGMGQGFSKMAKLKKREAVVFSFIVYRSRAHRDQVNKKVMKDPSMKNVGKMMKRMGKIMDMKHFAYGGFKVIVKARLPTV